MTAAVDIPGWMSVEELDWLAEQASTRSMIAEIGSWKGRSTKALADACPGRVFSVDNLHGEHKEPITPAALALAFYENLKKEIESKKVIRMCWDSVLVANTFQDGSLDMVFIDGDHEGNAPTRDIEAWLPKLKPSGLMCGHDRFHEGVKRALANRPHNDEPGSLWSLA